MTSPRLPLRSLVFLAMRLLLRKRPGRCRGRKSERARHCRDQEASCQARVRTQSIRPSFLENEPDWSVSTKGFRPFGGWLARLRGTRALAQAPGARVSAGRSPPSQSPATPATWSGAAAARPVGAQSRSPPGTPPASGRGVQTMTRPCSAVAANCAAPRGPAGPTGTEPLRPSLRTSLPSRATRSQRAENRKPLTGRSPRLRHHAESLRARARAQRLQLAGASARHGSGSASSNVSASTPESPADPLRTTAATGPKPDRHR